MTDSLSRYDYHQRLEALRPKVFKPSLTTGLREFERTIHAHVAITGEDPDIHWPSSDSRRGETPVPAPNNGELLDDQ